jgi:ribosomal protein L44E
MPNRQLNAAELVKAKGILDHVRAQLEELAGGDVELLFAVRRKVYKELTYDERGKPMARRRLKVSKRQAQGGLCPICEKPLPEKYCVLDRKSAVLGYTDENTRLICTECDTKTQSKRGYA